MGSACAKLRSGARTKSTITDPDTENPANTSMMIPQQKHVQKFAFIKPVSSTLDTDYEEIIQICDSESELTSEFIEDVMQTVPIVRRFERRVSLAPAAVYEDIPESESSRDDFDVLPDLPGLQNIFGASNKRSVKPKKKKERKDSITVKPLSLDGMSASEGEATVKFKSILKDKDKFEFAHIIESDEAITPVASPVTSEPSSNMEIQFDSPAKDKSDGQVNNESSSDDSSLNLEPRRSFLAMPQSTPKKMRSEISDISNSSSEVVIENMVLREEESDIDIESLISETEITNMDILTPMQFNKLSELNATPVIGNGNKTPKRTGSLVKSVNSMHSPVSSSISGPSTIN